MAIRNAKQGDMVVCLSRTSESELVVGNIYKVAEDQTDSGGIRVWLTSETSREYYSSRFEAVENDKRSEFFNPNIDYFKITKEVSSHG